jgi:GNAT superfamily N-acetyltransferase
MELLRTDRLLLRHWEEHGRDLTSPLGLWAVVLCAAGALPGQPVGTLLLLPLADGDGPTGLVEVGWHVHPRHQGQGMATEAARAVLALASTAGIDEVLAITDLGNTASQHRTVITPPGARGRRISAGRPSPYIPRLPSRVSRMRSAWPACRAVSSIRCSSTQRRLQSMTSVRAQDWPRSLAATICRDVCAAS